MKKLFKFFKKIFSKRDEEIVANATIISLPKFSRTETIALYLQDMFGGIIGARHPFDRAVTIFDIIICAKDGKEGKMLELELSYKEIYEDKWKEKAEQLLKQNPIT